MNNMSHSKHKLNTSIPELDFEKGSVSLFKDWLYENYSLKVNALDIDDIYIDKTEVNPIDYKFAITENDIYLHALEDGIKTSRSLINSILSSPNHCEHFNPICEYLLDLKGRFSGDSQLDMLSNSLIPASDEEADTNKYIFKKWMVAAAACVFDKRPNDVALGVISDKAGIGKTTFFEEIIPYELRKYTGNVLKSSSNQLPEYLFGNRLLLNFDELAALTVSTESQFKMLMSSRQIITKIPGTRRRTLVQRLSSVCFTSNKTSEQGGFIRSNDPGILRRLGVINVKGIADYREFLNVEMLWAEVMMMLEGGFDYVWNQDDFKMLTERNRKYILTTNAMRIIRTYFTLPGTGDKIRHMSARDVVLYLKQKRQIPSSMSNVDEVSIGQALSSLGFRRVTKRVPNIGPRYVYEMKAVELQ